jgi:hypothetical protein
MKKGIAGEDDDTDTTTASPTTTASLTATVAMGVLGPPLSRLRSIRYHIFPRRRLTLLIISLFISTTIVLYARGSSDLGVATIPLSRPAPEPITEPDPPAVVGSLTGPPPHASLAPWTPVPQNEELRLRQKHKTWGGSSANEYRPEKQPQWLIAINSPVTDFTRRKIIRDTWLRTYQDRAEFDHVFFMANPGRQAAESVVGTGWAERIAAENATFGDIVVLDNIPDDYYTAKTVQPLEFFSWLTRHRDNQTYKFVTKLESDVFLNVAGLWDRYVGQWLDDKYAQRTLLGQRIVSRRDGVELVHTHGMTYTLGWELMTRVAGLYAAHKTPFKEREDLAPAVLLTAAAERYRVVSLTLDEAHTYWEPDSRGDGTPWARRASPKEWAWHALRPQAIAVAGLSNDRLYSKIAVYFDRDGPRSTPPVRSWKGERVAVWVQALDGLWRFGLAGQGLTNPHAPSEEPEVHPWQSPFQVPEINGPPPLSVQSCDFWQWCSGAAGDDVDGWSTIKKQKKTQYDDDGSSRTS